MIVISWHGLPQYAAREIKAFCDQTKEDVRIVGTRPTIPIKGMVEVLGRPIIWIDNDNDELSWEGLGLPVPEVFVQAGWRYPCFLSLGRQVKKEGGFVIGLSDNRYRGDLRQWLGRFAFRLLYRRHFDMMMVPGESGKRLMRFYGMPNDRIICGLYGVDPKLFKSGPLIDMRPKTFLFVGQFIPRKGVDILCRAFARFQHTHSDWKLLFCGSGPLREKLLGHPGIIVKDFVQPEELSALYRQARFLVLPSFSEGWPLVVHEATLSGCGLLLSDVVGRCSCDLVCSENVSIFRAGDEEDILNSLNEVISWDALRCQRAKDKSCELARNFGPERFASELTRAISTLRCGK